MGRPPFPLHPLVAHYAVGPGRAWFGGPYTGYRSPTVSGPRPRPLKKVLDKRKACLVNSSVVAQLLSSVVGLLAVRVPAAAGNAYVTGFTDSTNFPTTPGAFQTAFGGGARDAFVTKLNAAGS